MKVYDVVNEPGAYKVKPKFFLIRWFTARNKQALFLPHRVKLPHTKDIKKIKSKKRSIHRSIKNNTNEHRVLILYNINVSIRFAVRGM